MLFAFCVAAVAGVIMPQEALADRPIDVLLYGISGVIGAEHIELLESRAYVVEVSDEPPTIEQMGKASVVVGGHMVHDAKVREALAEYVYGGGRLLLMVNTEYATCGTEKPCWYDFTKDAFGFRFDGDVQHGAVRPAEGSEQHPVWNSPNTISELTDWCCDAYIEEIVDEQNIKTLATVSGQSYEHGAFSTVLDVPVIVVNDNPEWGGGMAVGAGRHIITGWNGPDMRMFENLIAFMVSGATAVDSDPIELVPVAAVTDEVDGFTELDGAHSVEMIQISGRTYAVVASADDDGIQIIDITNPAEPAPVAAITDGVDGFTELDGAHNVGITQISGRTYAVVASPDDDGIQIIDITNPAEPAPVAAITDGVDGFTELDGAHNVGITQISGRTYAVVASPDDDGIQIIDITNPAEPAPVAAITDGVDGFTELDGAQGVEIAHIDGKTYAVVAGRIDDGIQIIDITDPTRPVPVAAVTDGVDGFTNLDGVVNVGITQISDRTYAVVASIDDDGIQIIEISRISPQVAVPHPASEGGFYTNLDAVIEVTDYQRTEYGDNSLIQITARITNQEGIIIIEPNHQNNYKDGEVLVFLGGTMPPPSKGTEYRNSFGFGDRSYQWLRANGADVSVQDCTSEGYWTDIKPAETGVERLCFWVPSNFTPDGLFMAIYDVLDGETTTDLSNVIIRAQIIPFTASSAYCSDHPDICNVGGLQIIDSGTYTDPHPPHISYRPDP